jgi:hypothetical protein
LGYRRFLALLKGLSPDAVWRQTVMNEPPEVEGHDAVSALVSQL